MTHKDEAIADAAPPQSDNLDKQARVDEQIARLKAVKRLASFLKKLERLQDRSNRRFPEEVDLGSESYKQRLALEQAKSARSPDVFLGQGQQALDEFFNQLDLVFKTKPLTYSLNQDKCVYAAGNLADIPAHEWNAE